MLRGAFAVVLVFLLSACAAKGPGADGGACDAGRPFGDACTQACECASQVCFEFGNGASMCSLTCTGNTECPSGSQGQKCNGQGYCRP